MSPPRWVLDTNVVVAGLLWSGNPRRLLELALDGNLELVSSPAPIAKLARTLGYPKFAGRVTRTQTSIDVLIERYAAMIVLAQPQSVPRVVAGDADDDHVIACAIAGEADAIVSGDRHLLELQPDHRGVAIFSPRQAIERFG